MEKNMGFITACVHAGAMEPSIYETMHTPLYLTSNYRLPTDGSLIDWDNNAAGVYSRHGNENETALETKIAKLEGAEDCAVYASGVAALNAVFMTFLSSGDHVICSQVCYSAVNKLFTWVLPKQFNIEVSFVDTTDVNQVEAAIKSNTKLIHIETPGNPTCLVSDIEAISRIAKAKKILVSVDSTFASPYCQNALECGADFAIHSLTKYCNGHGDALGGGVSGKKELIHRLKQQANIVNGGILSPFNAWLINRGLVTLPLRMHQHCENGMAVAKYLESKPEVRYVYYPGLDSNPTHDVAVRQMKNGFSGMISFGLKADAKTSYEFMSALKLIKRAVSLGDADTIINFTGPDDELMPRFTTDMQDGFFRLSVGLEDIGDILADFDQAFSQVFRI